MAGRAWYCGIVHGTVLVEFCDSECFLGSVQVNVELSDRDLLSAGVHGTMLCLLLRTECYCLYFR
jgi:hypothetical protein